MGRGLLESFGAKKMLGYQHSGFSVDAGVSIGAADRASLESLLRHCARPAFSMERLRRAGSELVYRCARQYSELSSDKRGTKADELNLTPLELIDRIAALVPRRARTGTATLGCWHQTRRSRPPLRLWREPRRE